MEPSQRSNRKQRLDSIRRAQALVAPYTAGAPSLADELIAERRAEAEREDDSAGPSAHNPRP